MGNRVSEVGDPSGIKMQLSRFPSELPSSPSKRKYSQADAGIKNETTCLPSCQGRDSHFELCSGCLHSCHYGQLGLSPTMGLQETVEDAPQRHHTTGRRSWATCSPTLIAHWLRAAPRKITTLALPTCPSLRGLRESPRHVLEH